MRNVVICLIALVCVACGYNPEEPLYDTQANPEGFPQQALRLIKLVEADSLRTVERANIEFGELYVDHPSLLDNSGWRSIISRMGARFMLRAQDELQDGIRGFESAGNYYTLAAFARPEDKAAGRMARLLEPWLAAKENKRLNTQLESPPRNSQQLHQQLEDLRLFLFGDSVSQVFARELLIPRLTELFSRTGDLAQTMQTNLSLADRSLMAYMGMLAVPTETAAVFVRPEVKLITHRLVNTGDAGLRLELYLLPSAAISDDYTVAVRALLPTDPESASPTERPRASFDFKPVVPTSQWVPDKPVVIGHILPVTDIADSLHVGFYTGDSDDPKWGSLANTQDTLFVLSRPEAR